MPRKLKQVGRMSKRGWWIARLTAVRGSIRFFDEAPISFNLTVRARALVEGFAFF
jgi:hypothetical protein